MSYGVLIPNAIAAQNVDAWVRSAVCASAVENGNIVILTGKSTTAGEAEVWTAAVPATTSPGLTGAWMVYEPELVWTGSYRGLDPDVRNFRVAATKIFTVFKPQLGDIITLTADNFSGAKGTTNDFGNATDSTGGLKLVWGDTQTGSVFSVKHLATTYISIGTGAIGSHQVTAFKCEVVGL
jgi:hypothetical protein